MKRIIVGLAVIAAAATMLVGVSKAALSDTETSENNTLAAGTIDLNVNGDNDPVALKVDLTGMKPGDTALYDWELKNVGNVNGQPWVEVTPVVNHDNGCNEPEGEVDDTCGDSQGDLGGHVIVKVSTSDTGYFYNHTDPQPPPAEQLTIPPGGEHYLNWWGEKRFGSSAASEGFTQVIPVLLAGGVSTQHVKLEFRLPTQTGNLVQSDSARFNVVFHLDQI